jgi:hypothetical protein
MPNNPYNDRLDFVGCPPQPAELELPEFREELEQECQLIRWSQCGPAPDGKRRMRVIIKPFEPDPNRCSVYNGSISFVDSITGHEWYRGELRFHYTRNYIYRTETYSGIRQYVAFRFVAKGDMIRVSEEMPENPCLILCSKESERATCYEDIFVYGGLDIIYDIERREFTKFRLNLGHNDGWYTHHPNCSARPIDWAGIGDYIGHYCERGWLFVSPGSSFQFNRDIMPPTGRFTDEAMREVSDRCHTEELIKDGELNLRDKRCIHYYQKLYGSTQCEKRFESANLCQGYVYTGIPTDTITFLSMGYWTSDLIKKPEQSLHLAEGNIRIAERENYFYGFATRHLGDDFKLVDLANNNDIIGKPEETDLLLYLYNPGLRRFNPLVVVTDAIDPRISALRREKELSVIRDMETCPFVKKMGEEGEKQS